MKNPWHNLIFFLVLSIFASSLVSAEGSRYDGHTIPINLPSGGGIKPSLSFKYHSNNDNSIVRTGWTIDGLFQIERAPGDHGLEFQGGDQYIAPHGKLIPLGNQLYRTENEPWVRYQAIFKSDLNNRNYDPHCTVAVAIEPCAWEKRDPSGKLFIFGSKNTARIQVANNDLNGIRVWALSKVVDGQGNYYEIEYITQNGGYRPDTISYSFDKNGKRTLKEKLKFHYFCIL